MRRPNIDLAGHRQRVALADVDPIVVARLAQIRARALDVRRLELAADQTTAAVVAQRRRGVNVDTPNEVPKLQVVKHAIVLGCSLLAHSGAIIGCSERILQATLGPAVMFVCGRQRFASS